MVNIAMARPYRSGGLMLNSTVWVIGIIGAAATPCSMRNRTSSGRLVAIPQSTEVAVKAPILANSMGLMPNLAASQPVTGMVTAVATM